MLYCIYLFSLLELKGVKSTQTNEEDRKKLNQRTIELIKQCVGQLVFHHIPQNTDAYTLWTTSYIYYTTIERVKLFVDISYSQTTLPLFPLINSRFFFQTPPQTNKKRHPEANWVNSCDLPDNSSPKGNKQIMNLSPLKHGAPILQELYLVHLKHSKFQSIKIKFP